MTEYRRKLIEVALPLDAINTESARQKSIQQGHPSSLHPWWSRKPLAAARAVLFAQMVDDPSALVDEFPSEDAQATERLRLFRIIEELVKWENTTNEAVLHAARVEIARSAARNHGVSLPHVMSPAQASDALRAYAPAALDPFAGGGSIPLEAQRLGLEANACDLNPVAVLINKALIEIPPKFAGRPPTNPDWRARYLNRDWKGAEGLAEDIVHYGRWMRDEARRRIGHLYPKARVPAGLGGGEATVIAWLWIRTVRCPNPACGIAMPLTSKWNLSTKKGSSVHIEPHVDLATKSVSFHVRQGLSGRAGTITTTGAACIACGREVPFDYIRTEGFAGRMSMQMLAVVAVVQRNRVFLDPVETANTDTIDLETNVPDTELPEKALGFRVQKYGIARHAQLFTPRQRTLLGVLSDLVPDARNMVLTDSGGDQAYADSIAAYLGLIVGKAALFHNALSRWRAGETKTAPPFGRQTVSLVWDIAETNPFAEAGGDLQGIVDGSARVVRALPATPPGKAWQADAAGSRIVDEQAIISSDPPYYDNIGYADLSDFFYVWLRLSLKEILPELFATRLTPKGAELIAVPHRFDGSVQRAKHFFETGLGTAFGHMRAIEDAGYPLTVYYAFKQAETNDEDEDGRLVSATPVSTGWETMLEGLIHSELAIVGTWPLRTESATRMRSISSNALASSIVLVCRPRPVDASQTTRRDFLNALKRELPRALRDLQRGYIAPVDLAQAAIGPGMGVFSRYSKVLESDGTSMRVRTALQLINQTLDEVLAEQEGEYDADTRWAVAWFEQYGMEEGPFGAAETLSKAKNTSVEAMRNAGIVKGPGGKVRLVRRDELPEPWNPAAARRLTAWEVTQRLIRALETEGEQGAAAILDHVGALGEIARDLAYRLYTVCERKKWTEEALAYNSLVVEWADIAGAAEQIQKTTATQTSMF